MLRIIFASLVMLGHVVMAETSVTVAYFKIEQPRPPVLSNLDPIPEDLGQSGAVLGISDNNTTGQFLGQTYVLEETIVSTDSDPLPSFRSVLDRADYIILDASASDIMTLANLPEAASKLLFNASAPDTVLRDVGCQSNVLHTVPSFAMRSDALMQVLLKKRWSDVALIQGTFPQDRAFADAIKSSIAKFGLRLRSEKEWVFDADMRRSASSEIPIFTQSLKSHDILIIADEVHDFGRYVAYNTWEATPLAGSEGLRPLGWDRTVEQWGAAQLQSRFDKIADRPMRDLDYAAWAAVRSIGEAVTRTNATDPETIKRFIFSDEFELAGFKGRPLSYRSWNGQLRQPIPVVSSNALVAQAPLEGFLHQSSELDTLGIDKQESKCAQFKENK